MLRRSRVMTVAVLAAMLVPPVVSGQSLGDMLKDAVNRRATQMAEEAIDKGLDTAEDAVRCVVTDQACIERAQESGEDVVLTNKKGKPLPPEKQPQQGSAATTVTGNAATAPTRQATWDTQTGYRDAGKIIVADGVVVTGNISGKGGTYAYDAVTGKRLWQAPGHLRAGPVTDGRRVYTSNTGVGVTAFDLKTGKVAWKAADAETADNLDLLLYDGRVFAVGGHGVMRVYDADSGRALWTHEHMPGGYMAHCPTTPAGADGLVFYAGGEMNPPAQVYLWALNAATGELAWRQAVKPKRDDRYGSCVTSAAVGSGVVAVASRNVMIGLDARTGAEKWRRAVERRVNGELEPRDLSEPFIHGHRVYAIFEEGLIGWDLASGRPEFEFAGRFPSRSYPRTLAFADGAVFLIANLEQPHSQDNRQGFLYAVDLATGQVQWKHRVNREKPYFDTWPTTWFAADGSAVYYENAGFIARVDR